VVGVIDLVDASEDLQIRTQSTNNIRIQSSGDISFYEDTGTTPKFFWDASTERLGIGNVAPTTALDVTGTVTADGASLDGAVVINESGADVDFRVEGDTDANLLFVDASTDRVGVGTNAPDALLTVDGIASFGAGAAATPSIAAAGDLNTGVWFPAADTIAASTAGTERLRIDSSGNLGLGVTPSAWTTLKPIQFAGGASLAGLGNVGYLGANCYYDGSWRYIASATSGRYEVAADHKWFNAASGTAGNAITFTQAMTLNASGFLGIGQTSPICYVDIYGNGGYTYARFWRSDEAGYGGRVGTGNTLHGSASARSLGLDGFNQISFGIAGSQVAQIDSSGNLGIGTTSPDASMGPGLHIKSASGNSLILEKDTGAAIQFRSDASTIRATIGGINGADGLTIATGAAQTERLRITSAGNVGIGTTAPDYQLHVTTTFAVGASGFNQQLSFTNDTIQSLLLGTGYTTLKLNPLGGSVNIGGTNGAAKFEVNNAVSTTGSLTDSTINLATTAVTGRKVNIGFGLPGGVGNTNAATIGFDVINGAGALQGDLFFSTRGSTADSVPTERMRIDSTGNLLVATTTSSLTSGDGFVFTPDANVAGAKTGYSTDTQTCWNMYSSGAAAYRFYVGWGGTVFATNTTISAISDQRLKENIQDLDAGLDKIMALKPRQFDWKEGKGKNVKGDRGFIAQEFEQVFPDLIDEWKDPAPEGEDPYKSVRADLIPVLVKAIQEQQAIIDSLKSRLDAAGL
jgi:hypothetical protein